MSKNNHLVELNFEISRLSQFIRWRQKFPELGLEEVPFEQLWEENQVKSSSRSRPKTSYRKLIYRMDYPKEERILLLLALVGIWYPSFFAKHFLKEQVSYLPRTLTWEELDPLCGLSFQDHNRTLYPSFNTFIYLLAGQNLMSRAQVLLHLYRRDYCLIKKNIVYSEKTHVENYLSAPLHVQPTWFSALLGNNSLRVP